MRAALLAAAVLAGLALLGAAAYLYAARAPAPPMARLAAETGEPGFAFTPHPEPRPLPGLRFVAGDGRELSLADFRGRVVLLNVWATWCVPCREEMPSLDRLQAELGGPGFEVVSLSIDRGGLEVVTEFYDGLDLEALGIYLDRPGEAMRALGVTGIPTTLLVDRDGREIGRVLGAAAWDGPEAVDLIRRYLETPSGAVPSATRRLAAATPRAPRCLPVPGRTTSWAGQSHTESKVLNQADDPVIELASAAASASMFGGFPGLFRSRRPPRLPSGAHPLRTASS